MQKSLISAASLAGLLVGAPAALAASPEEDLVARWLKGTSFGLDVSIGSSRFEPAARRVVLENVMIGRDGDLLRMSYPSLAVEDPRMTADGLFAAHSLRVDGLSGDVTVDLRRLFPDLARIADEAEARSAETPTAPDAPSPAPSGPGEAPTGGAESPSAEVAIDAEIAPDKPFDVAVAVETLFYERLVMPMETPDLSDPNRSSFRKMLDLGRWATRIRLDWAEYVNFTTETKGAPDGDMLTAYGRQYFLGMAEGRISRAGFEAMEQKPAAGNTAYPLTSYTVGDGWMIGLDLAAYLDAIDPAAYRDGKGDGVWRTVLASSGTEDIALEFEGGALTVEALETTGFRLRQTEKPLLEVIERMMADPEGVDRDPMAFVGDLLPAISGLWGLDAAVLTNMEVSVGADTSFKMERADVTGLSSEGLAALTLRGLEGRADGGSAGLSLFAMTDLRFGDLMSWIRLGESVDANPDGEPEAAAIRSMMLEGVPAISYMELESLTVESPLGRVSLDALGVTSGDFLMLLARRGDLTFTNLSIPVAMLPDPTVQEQLTGMGYETLDISGALSLGWDTDRGDIRLEDMTVKVADMGTLSADLHIGNLPLSIYDDPAAIEARMQQGTLVAGSIAFGNQSIVERTFEAQAKNLNQPPEDFRKNVANAMPFMLGFLEDRSLQQRFAEVLKTFFNDPKSLVLSMKPVAPVPFEVLSNFETEDPTRLFDLLKLELVANR